MRLPQTVPERGTPVVGPAQPLKGLSGRMRRVAYGIPEHHARHWLLLLVADRIDLMEHRMAEATRGRPAVLALAVVSGVLVGGAMAQWWRARR